MKMLKMTARVGIYSFGMLVLAFGVAFSINANLGISPVSSFPISVHMASGMGAGFSNSLFFVVCVLLQLAILRKDFHWIQFTQILFTFLFGFFIDAAIWIVGDFTLPTYFGQLVMLGLSIACISIGLAIYLEARLVPLPAEGVVLAFMQKYPNLTFQRIKVVLDCTLVAFSIATTLFFMGGIYGVREGTIITALLVGRLTPIVRRVVEKTLKPAALYENV